MNNRFAALYVDDDTDELSPPVEALPSPAIIPSPSSAFSKVTEKKVVEKKTSEKKKQVEFRDFGATNTQSKKDIFNKRNPFRKSIGTRYAFKDENPHKPLVSPIQAPYKFIDESVPLEPFQPPELKDAEKQTIIFSSTIGNSVSSGDLTSLPL